MIQSGGKIPSLQELGEHLKLSIKEMDEAELNQFSYGLADLFLYMDDTAHMSRYVIPSKEPTTE